MVQGTRAIVCAGGEVGAEPWDYQQIPRHQQHDLARGYHSVTKVRSVVKIDLDSG